MQNLKVLLFALMLVFSVVPFASADEAPQEQAMAVINVNTADVVDLTQLKGIGEKKAEAIIAWREQNGPFESLEQLLEVRGIGQSTLAQNRERIVLQ
ncbi:MAG TPA: ComEA family DNA-binding protein [Cellvibrionaceae bacterium]